MDKQAGLALIQCIVSAVRKCPMHTIHEVRESSCLLQTALVELHERVVLLEQENFQLQTAKDQAVYELAYVCKRARAQDCKKLSSRHRCRHSNCNSTSVQIKLVLEPSQPMKPLKNYTLN